MGKMLEFNEKQGHPPLKIIALGALMWSEFSNDFDDTQYDEGVRDLLQLRVYHIHYQYDVQGICSPVLRLIAKGSPRNIQGLRLNILPPYWL